MPKRRFNPLAAEDRELAAWQADQAEWAKPNPKPIPGLRMMHLRTVHGSQVAALGLSKVMPERKVPKNDLDLDVGCTIKSLERKMAR